MKKRIHYLQHVSYEGLGCIEEWALTNGYILSSTQLYEHTSLPQLLDFDWLIIMGGPMSVNDEDTFSWLKPEKELIGKAIRQNKKVIGICLGAQLIASALGAKVYPNQYKEIGWHPIQITKNVSFPNPLSTTEGEFLVFHWHGDAFDLPSASHHLAYSNACLNQAFMYGKNVVGLQFHLEITEALLQQLLYFGKAEMVDGKYIQTSQAMLRNKQLIETNNRRMFTILAYLEAN